MISENTLFILGAGASRPYGYPTGSELREEICCHFVGDSKSYFEGQGAQEPYIRSILTQAETFVKKFNKSSTKSIDLFLARNPEFELMGKYAIIFRIFAAEKSSGFREHTKIKKQDWYSYLFDRLTDELTKKDDYSRFSENNVSFITFNYDRSLEHFLYESLINSFNEIPPHEIKKQINKIKIIHVFGQVAGLEWQDFESKIAYKWDVNQTDVKRLTDKLRIIYEEKENPSLEEARKIISDAQRIFFLGFGYAKENLELLNIPGILKQKQRIRGTALGSTQKEKSDIVSSLTLRSGNMFLACDIIIRNDWDSLQLLREYL